MKTLTLKPTAIGSLPFKNPDEALDVIFNNFKDIPFWPQLPHLSHKEDMCFQYTQNLCGLEIDKESGKAFLNCESDLFYENLEELYTDFESVMDGTNLSVLEKYRLKQPYSSSIELFLNRIEKIKPAYAKGHVTGVFTMATSFCDESGKCAYYNDTLLEVISKTIILKAVSQILDFKKAHKDITPIIFMDEPSISQLGSSAFLTVQKSDIANLINETANAIKKFGALSAIHCCGKTDWALIMQSNVDLINFDAYFYSQSLSTFSNDIESFISRGGYLAWGIVPTLDKTALINSDLNFLTDKFSQGIKYLTDKGLNEEKIIKQSLITPSCGAGSLDIENAIKAMNLTREVAKTLSQRYGVKE